MREADGALIARCDQSSTRESARHYVGSRSYCRERSGRVVIDVVDQHLYPDCITANLGLKTEHRFVTLDIDRSRLSHYNRTVNGSSPGISDTLIVNIAGCTILLDAVFVDSTNVSITIATGFIIATGCSQRENYQKKQDGNTLISIALLT